MRSFEESFQIYDHIMSSNWPRIGTGNGTQMHFDMQHPLAVASKTKHH